MNAEQLNAIKERAAKATPGPWDETDDLFVIEGDGLIIGELIAKTETKADATFIAHAREDVPALVAEVERLNTVKHRLNSDVELYRKQYEGAQIQLSESEAENERLRKALEYFADDENYFYGIAGECNVLDIGRKLAREALGIGEESNAL